MASSLNKSGVSINKKDKSERREVEFVCEIPEFEKEPISEIEGLKSRCIEVEGLKESLKSPLEKVSDKIIRKAIKHAHPEEIEMAQKLLAVRHQLKLIQQLMDLIKTGTIDLENPQVRSALLELRDMLNKLEVRI